MAPSQTTSEIIAQAAYLSEDFEPKSLTVPQLLGILSHHGIPYGNTKKTALIQLFNDTITSNLSSLRAQRLAIDGSQASDRGITDGITGRQVNDPETPPPVRRSSRRGSSRTSIEPATQESSVTSRRSSAGPSNGRAAPRGRRAPVVAEIIEASDSEDDEVPVVPVRKSKAQPNEPRKSRRSSSSKGANDSGWDDTNVFQSGPEDSPPPMKSEGRQPGLSRRRSSLAISGSGVPDPQVPLGAAPPTTRKPVSRLRQSIAAVQEPEPVAPYSKPASRSSNRRTRRPPTPTPEPETPPKSDTAEILEYEDGSEQGSGLEEYMSDGEGYNAVVSSKMGDLSPQDRDSRTLSIRPQSTVARLTAAGIPIAGILLLALVFVSISLFKIESSSIGYCDAGTSSNRFLDDLRGERRAAYECNAKLITNGPDKPETRLVDGVVCPLESLLPIPPPDDCTPCPHRATCTQNTVLCNGAFILQEHPFAHVPLLGSIANGLPGLGSVAFPSTCVEDRKRLRHVGLLEKSLESWLAKTKGDKMCKGIAKSTDGGDAKAWGVPLNQLRDTAHKSLKRKLPEATFMTMFDDATTKLIHHGLVVSEVDSSDVQYVAALRSDMDLTCQFKVMVNDAWDAWRRYLYALAFIIVSLAYTNSRVASNRAESRRIAELVQIALETLRFQELEHHTDPVSTPFAHLSSMHLRDLVLQDEHSAVARKRLWEKVERVVEGNANVRANIEEVNGDETRVWRWTGSTSSISPKKVQWKGEN